MASKGAYPITCYVVTGPAWKAWGTYGMMQPQPPGFSDLKAVGYGLLAKTRHLDSRDLVVYYCPGRDRDAWPASNIFDRINGWGTDDEGYALSYTSCYNLRGFRFDMSKEWRFPRKRQAIAADMFINYPRAVEAHGNGLNVGFSDGSVIFVLGTTQMSEFGIPFFTQLQVWQPSAASNIQEIHHHQAYNFFDTQ
jgi:prepilin-type processing-associated H-X9-DG protein